jgi:hypothetical protein
MLYLHPDAAKALKRYAVDQNTKVHDLLLEAVEDWFRRHGLREPVRADTRRTRPTDDGGTRINAASSTDTFASWRGAAGAW